MRILSFLSSTLLVVGFSMGIGLSATYYVSSGGSSTNPCTQTQPCDFQTALDNAKTDGQDSTIIVAPGTYNVTSTYNYNIPGGDGRLTIQAQDPNNKPILDGGSNTQIMKINTAAGTDTNKDITLKNIIFQKGKSSWDGGGLSVATNSANVTVNGCEFKNNTAANSGGGAHITQSSGNATFTNNVFTGNAAKKGGGAYTYSVTGNATIRDNTFTSNSADYGGGVYRNSSQGGATFTNNTFTSNAANTNGGGIYGSSTAGNVILTGNVFTENTASNWGGGAYVSTFQSNGILNNNIFNGNRASYGGGVSAITYRGTTTLTNNTYYGNMASSYGGGIHSLAYYDGYATTNIYNNVSWGNIAYAGGSDGDDFYGDTDGDADGTGSTINVFNNDFGSNSDFTTGQSEDFVITRKNNYNHGNNLTQDPMFVDASNSDFHLKSTSSVIDKGNNNAPSLPAKDFEGDDRKIDGDKNGIADVDIGADEYKGTGSGSGGGSGSSGSGSGTPPTPPPQQSEPEYGSKKLSNGSIIKIEGGVFNAITELKSAPNNCLLPVGVKVYNNWLRFIAKVDAGEKGVWIELELPQILPPNAKVGKCTKNGFRFIDDVKVNGRKIRFYIKDGSEFDYDGKVDGYVRDPFAVIAEEPTTNQPKEQQPGQPEGGQQKEQPGTSPPNTPSTGDNNGGSGGGGCSTGGTSILLYLLVFVVPFLRRFRDNI